MNYVNARCQEEITLSLHSICGRPHMQFMKTTMYRACLHSHHALVKSKISSQSLDSSLFCDLFFKAALSQLGIRASCSHKTLTGRGGGLRERDCGKVTGCPYLASSDITERLC